MWLYVCLFVLKCKFLKFYSNKKTALFWYYEKLIKIVGNFLKNSQEENYQFAAIKLLENSRKIHKNFHKQRSDGTHPHRDFDIRTKSI